MYKIINLTPHTINFHSCGKIYSIPSSGIARATSERTQINTINGFPVYTVSYGNVENLPEPKENTIYVVSALTAQAVPDREDVFIVDDTIRDENNRIIGCRGLAHI